MKHAKYYFRIIFPREKDVSHKVQKIRTGKFSEPVFNFDNIKKF